MDEAGQLLAQLVLQEYLEARIKHSFSVWFPGSGWQYYDELKVLRDIELAALHAVAAQLRNDVASLTPFYWESRQEREAMQDLAERSGRQLRNWEAEYRSEAASHSNWSGQRDQFSWKCGVACGQLGHISSFGWGGI